MDESQFLMVIYDSIEVGTKIRKPRKISEVLRITENGNIYYRIGENNQKAVTKVELVKTYKVLKKGKLSNSDLSKIVTKSKPCNVTTIKWLLIHANIAMENTDGTFTNCW